MIARFLIKQIQPDSHPFNVPLVFTALTLPVVISVHLVSSPRISFSNQWWQSQRWWWWGWVAFFFIIITDIIIFLTVMIFIIMVTLSSPFM